MKKVLAISFALVLFVLIGLTAQAEDYEDDFVASCQYEILSDGTIRVDYLEHILSPVVNVGSYGKSYNREVSAVGPNLLHYIMPHALSGLAIYFPASIRDIDPLLLDNLPPDFLFYTAPDSYAEQFCRDHHLNYTICTDPVDEFVFQFSYFSENEIRIGRVAEGISEMHIPDTIYGKPVTFVNSRFIGVKTLYFPAQMERLLGGDAYMNPGTLPNYYDLEKMILPEGLKSIAPCALFRSINLQSINIPDSVESIGQDIETGYVFNPFVFCPKLAEVNISPSHPYYALDPSGVLVSKADQTIVSYFPAVAGNASCFIPSGIRAIGIGAFALCETLEQVMVPEGVTEIKDNAFSDCSNLKTVHLPEGLETIGAGAFVNCMNLETINLPESIQRIDRRAFGRPNGRGRSSVLKAVVVPGSYAEQYCKDNDIEYTYQ